METSETETPAWDEEWLCDLLVYLRRQGIPAYEIRLVETKCISISFESRLAQAEILEGLLLDWPGIEGVERAGDGVLRAHGQRQVPKPRKRRVGRATFSRAR